MQKLQMSFRSLIGKHNLQSLAKNLGYDDLVKAARNVKDGKFGVNDFAKLRDTFNNTHKITDVEVRDISMKLIEAGINSLVKNGDKNI